MERFKFDFILVVLFSILILSIIILAFPKNKEIAKITYPIPNEVAHKEGYVKYTGISEDYKAGVAWMQTIHNNEKEGNSKVEVDWLKLYARVKGKDIVISYDDFDIEKVCGGLFTRIPWYGIKEEIGEAMPSSFNNGILILKPYERPNKVWHLWNCNRALFPVETTNIWMEARVRISGPALVQFGIDYWKDLNSPDRGISVNNVEAAVSNWYFEDDNWQVISVSKPA